MSQAGRGRLRRESQLQLSLIRHINDIYSSHDLTIRTAVSTATKGGKYMNGKTLLSSAILGLSWAISASAGNQATAPTTIGYLDPRTGALLPLVDTAAAIGPESPAASTELTGELKITGTVTIVSPSITSTTPISCSAQTILVSDANGPITEEAASAATRSGSTATCTVLIPYEWLLATPTTDKVTLSVTVTALSANARVHTHQVATFTVPANGSTTSFGFVTHL
jgi:hypothetical protein